MRFSFIFLMVTDLVALWQCGRRCGGKILLKSQSVLMLISTSRSKNAPLLHLRSAASSIKDMHCKPWMAPIINTDIFSEVVQALKRRSNAIWSLKTLLMVTDRYM